MPIVYVINGPSGAGKTYGVHQFMKDNNLTGDIYDFDALGVEHRGDQLIREFGEWYTDLVFFAYNRMRSSIINNRNVFFVTSLYEAYQRHNLNEVLQHLKVPIIFVYFDVSLQRCLQNNASKKFRSMGRRLNEDIVVRYNRIEPITYYEDLNFIIYKPRYV